MGYFDEIIINNKTEDDLNALKEEMIGLFGKRIERYESLENTMAYSKALSGKREETIEQFKKYFEDKGFNISSMRTQSSKKLSGAKAEIGDTTIELKFDNKRDFKFNITGVYSADFSLVDQEELEFNFSGFVTGGELYLNSNKSTEDYSTYLEEKKNILEDTDDIQKRIDSRYIPEMKIYKNGDYYENFSEFLEAINSQLKN